MFYFLPVCSSLSLASCNQINRWPPVSLLQLSSTHALLPACGRWRASSKVPKVLYLILPTPLCTSDIYFIKSSFLLSTYARLSPYTHNDDIGALSPCGICLSSGVVEHMRGYYHQSVMQGHRRAAPYEEHETWPMCLALIPAFRWKFNW